MALTGPPYPPLPGAGSNAIGVGALGTTLAIGDVPAFDWRRTIISQYANSPRIVGLVELVAGYLDPTANFEAFFDLVWNVDTAQGYGLDIWGRIVGVTRNLRVLDGDWFGFQEALPGSDSFNDVGEVQISGGFGFTEGDGAAFGEQSFGLVPTYGKGALTGGSFFSSDTDPVNYRLLDEDYRRLILVKAASNITDGSIPAINQILLGLFPHRGNCYVTDCPRPAAFFGFAEAAPTSHGFDDAGPVTILPGFGFQEADAATFGEQSFGEMISYPSPTGVGGFFYSGVPDPRMSISYTFEFQLTPVEFAIVKQSGVLPKPVGVAANVIVR